MARNGLEFEQMTKNKQKENPKFSFLFGGEHFNYYQYKVTTEQASKLPGALSCRNYVDRHILIDGFCLYTVLKQKSKQQHPVVSNLSDIGGHQLLSNSSGNSTSMDISAAVSAAQWLVCKLVCDFGLLEALSLKLICSHYYLI